MKRYLQAGLLAGFLPLSAYALTPVVPSFVVKDIRVEGIQRTEAGTVFNYLPVRVGEVFDSDKATQAVRALFATGFFRDVRIEAEGDVLLVLLEERPAIAQIDFSGLKEFDKDQLKKGLKDLGLAESRILDRAVLEKAEQELKRQYLSRGKYAVKIDTKVLPLERNRVMVSFAIDEGEVSGIKQINIVGAKAFSESELLDLFQLRTPNWLSWFTRNDQYSKPKLAADLEVLRSYYMDRGYVEFNLGAPQVAISPDRKDIFLSVALTEGEPYTVSGIKVAGQTVIPEEEYRQLVTVKPGELYSREQLNQTAKAIADRLGKEGYAFANVNWAPELDRDKKQVELTLYVDPGRRAYVRRINIGGNTKTRDEVIRREIRQMESGWYDADKISRSRERINRLGYFSDSTIETPAVPSTTDQVDVNVNVTERPTGNLMLGVGYSSSERFVVTGSISQENLFGTGKHLALQVNSGKINRTYSLSFTDPYFTPDGISQGFDIYTRATNPSSLSVGSYSTRTTGAGLRYGIPLGETQSLSVSVAGEESDLTLYADSPKRYKEFVDKFGDPTTTFTLGLVWGSDTRDSAYYPTRGGATRMATEYALPGSDLRYFRANLSRQHFVPLSRNYTLWLNAEYSQAGGLQGKELPFYKNYYAGGVGSVRGFRTASLGPCDTASMVCASTSERLGGNRKAIANMEILAPMPGSGLDRSVRLGLFVDAGQVWGEAQKVQTDDLRYSAGIGLAWYSPIGPMKFSYALPLQTREGDRLERFQFQLGSVF